MESMALKSKKSTRITVSLADEAHAELASLAEKYDVSLSWITRQAIVEFLKQHKKGGAQLLLDLPFQKRVGNE